MSGNLAAAAALVLLVGVSPAIAQTPTPTPYPCGSSPWVVTDEGDTTGTASLRWAIECANAELGAGALTINFAIPTPSGITITSRLEINRENLTIDGSTQSGAVAGDILAGALPVPAVVITGTVGSGCLNVNDSDVTLIGLQIICTTDTFDSALLMTGDGGVLRSSVIGDAGSGNGVRVGGNNVTIGGTSVGDGNVIRLVRIDGIHALVADGLTVYGNLLLDIGEDGLFLGEGVLTNTIIGGAGGGRNIIVGSGFGNNHSAIALGHSINGIDIVNNRIGVDSAGAADGNKWGIKISNTGGTPTNDVLIDSNLISATTNTAIDIATGITVVTISDNLIGTNAAGETAAGFCNGLPQINDQTSAATITGNTEGACVPTATPTNTPQTLGCCVLSCNPASLPAVEGGFCLDTDTGFGDVNLTFCDGAAGANCPPKVRFVVGGTCAGGCEVLAPTATATPTDTPTNTPTNTPTDTPTQTFTPAPVIQVIRVGISIQGALAGVAVAGAEVGIVLDGSSDSGVGISGAGSGVSISSSSSGVEVVQ